SCRRVDGRPVERAISDGHEARLFLRNGNDPGRIPRDGEDAGDAVADDARAYYRVDLRRSARLAEHTPALAREAGHPGVVGRGANDAVPFYRCGVAPVAFFRRALDAGGRVGKGAHTLALAGPADDAVLGRGGAEHAAAQSGGKTGDIAAMAEYADAGGGRARGAGVSACDAEDTGLVGVAHGRPTSAHLSRCKFAATTIVQATWRRQWRRSRRGG